MTFATCPAAGLSQARPGETRRDRAGGARQSRVGVVRPPLGQGPGGLAGDEGSGLTVISFALSSASRSLKEARRRLVLGGPPATPGASQPSPRARAMCLDWLSPNCEGRKPSCQGGGARGAATLCSISHTPSRSAWLPNRSKASRSGSCREGVATTFHERDGCNLPVSGARRGSAPPLRAASASAS